MAVPLSNRTCVSAASIVRCFLNDVWFEKILLGIGGWKALVWRKPLNSISTSCKTTYFVFVPARCFCAKLTGGGDDEEPGLPKANAGNHGSAGYEASTYRGTNNKQDFFGVIEHFEWANCFSTRTSLGSLTRCDEHFGV